MPFPVPSAALPPADALLRWYDRNRRTMPWRACAGESADPYRVWLSEIMLQQTTVATVIPYFGRFLDRFPSVEALAEAEVEAVMEAWAGLGYYARARNMHVCAREIAARGGVFPRTPEELIRLPGIGVYTAAAIASIAFGVPVVPVDGNIERVTARLFAIDTPLPAARPTIAAAAASLGGEAAARARPSDFTQALFDLGATICTARSPACTLCPWRPCCQAAARGDPARFPVKPARRARPVRYGVQFMLMDTEGRILLRRRAPNGLLGGMLELPGSCWRDRGWSAGEALAQAPQPATWQFKGAVAHGFTHFELRIDVYAASVAAFEADGIAWAQSDLAAAALPRVMRKCLALPLDSAGSPRVKGRAA